MSAAEAEGEEEAVVAVTAEREDDDRKIKAADFRNELLERRTAAAAQGRAAKSIYIALCVCVFVGMWVNICEGRAKECDLEEKKRDVVVLLLQRQAQLTTVHEC